MKYTVPILKPILPDINDLSSKIRFIDEQAWYTNNGPVVRKLEDRLSKRYHEEGHFVTVSNATLALTLTLQSLKLPKGSRCIVPSWTFSASPLAIVAAGLEPYFVDVNIVSQTPSVNQIRAAVSDPKNKISALMVIYPFGQPIDHEYWETLTAELNLELVFDAAAAFDRWKPTSAPSVISLHATKILPAAEGAVVFSKDQNLINELRSRANFGFSSLDRTATFMGTNAKLSEYHAAIALCSLEEYDTHRKSLEAVALKYIQHLDNSVYEVPDDFGSWLAMTMSVKIPESHDIARLEKYLSAHGIQTRRWWSPCHLMPAFQTLPCSSSFQATEFLHNHTIGLPFGRHHSIVDHVESVCKLLLSFK